MLPKGSLYIISSPSGAGKSSLLAALIAQDQDHSIRLSVSYTTRPARPREIDGQHYCFIDKDQFNQLIKQEEFLEYAQVFDYYYGTSNAKVNQSLDQGIDVFLDIDWQGRRQVKQQFTKAKSIFILPPNKQALAQRLKQREQDSAEVIQQRMAKANSEINHFHEYDYLIINDNFAKALLDLQNIVYSQRLTVNKQSIRQSALINKLLVFE